jgi:diamine N-acetyltransferase
MQQILPIAVGQLPLIRKLALSIWPDTFSGILTPNQITYMLDQFYSISALENQVEKKGHCFMIFYEDDHPLGFVSYQLKAEKRKTKIHKLYVLQESQGKGIGKKLIQRVTLISRDNQEEALFLNVNKYNHSAIAFYEYIGFRKTKEEIIDIGEGFVMDDYVMEWKF